LESGAIRLVADADFYWSVLANSGRLDGGLWSPPAETHGNEESSLGERSTNSATGTETPSGQDSSEIDLDAPVSTRWPIDRSGAAHATMSTQQKRLAIERSTGLIVVSPDWSDLLERLAEFGIAKNMDAAQNAKVQLKLQTRQVQVVQWWQRFKNEKAWEIRQLVDLAAG
jgi:hypothetical protein